MTHVLDEAIEDLEGQLREDWRRRVYSMPRMGQHLRLIRSTVAALRILRAEREGTRQCAAPPGPDGERPDCDAYEASESGAPCPPGYCAVKREPTPDELHVHMLDDYSRLGSRVAAMLDNARAEGRREERERVVAHLERMASRCDGHGSEDKAQAYEDASFDVRDGDHWRGGEG